MATRISLFLMTLALLSGPAAAEGDPEAGKAKSAVCAACHGVDGNSVNAEWPSLAGQHAGYALVQLQAFKDGSRSNPLMSAQAAVLNEQDMQDLAAYYESQTLKGGTAEPSLARQGQRLYRGGNATAGAPACASCHGPSGKGNPLAGFPVIAGQHAKYTEMQLAAYAKSERRSDSNQMMRNVAASLSDNEIKAVAAYLQGLRDAN